MQTAQSISALQRVTGNTPRQFLRCDVHYSQFSSKYKKHEKYTWCIELFCSLCSTSWYVCFECFINQRMTKKQQLYRHNKLYHSFVVSREKHVDANTTNKLSVLPAVANVDCNDLLTDTGVESKNQMAPETDEHLQLITMKNKMMRYLN